MQADWVGSCFSLPCFHLSRILEFNYPNVIYYVCWKIDIRLLNMALCHTMLFYWPTSLTHCADLLLGTSVGFYHIVYLERRTIIQEQNRMLQKMSNVIFRFLILQSSNVRKRGSIGDMWLFCQQQNSAYLWNLNMSHGGWFWSCIYLKLDLKVLVTGLWLRTYYPPWKRGDIGLSLSVCPSVCLSVFMSVRRSVPFDVGYFVQASFGMKELS